VKCTIKAALHMIGSHDRWLPNPNYFFGDLFSKKRSRGESYLSSEKRKMNEKRRNSIVKKDRWKELSFVGTR